MTSLPFLNSFSDKVEDVSWQSKAKPSKLCKPKVGHRKNL